MSIEKERLDFLNKCVDEIVKDKGLQEIKLRIKIMSLLYMEGARNFGEIVKFFGITENQAKRQIVILANAELIKADHETFNYDLTIKGHTFLFDIGLMDEKLNTIRRRALWRKPIIGPQKEVYTRVYETNRRRERKSLEKTPKN